MFYPNKIFNKKSDIYEDRKPGFFILDEDITNTTAVNSKIQERSKIISMSKAPQKTEEPWALFSGSQ